MHCLHTLFYSILLLFCRSVKSYRLEDYYCCCYYYYYGTLGSQKLILKISWAKRTFACMARWLWTGIAYWYFQDCCKMCLSRQHSDCAKWVLFLFFLLLGCSWPCCSAVSSLVFQSSALRHVTVESLCNSCCLARNPLVLMRVFVLRAFLH